MTFYLIGGRGRLGRSLAAEYGPRGLVTLDRSIYAEWSNAGAADMISRYFGTRLNENATVFVTSGLLDPKLAQDDLLKINYHLPKALIDGAAKLGIKVITFGTVMEGLVQSGNPYIQSKLALRDHVSQAASAGWPAIHLQIHTMYGIGQPSPFMFLGQILTALQSNSPFKMTAGRQLREYHHLADEAKAIRQIAESGLFGVMNVSHGKPVTLRTVAEEVFKAFGKDGLLRLGALPEPRNENYTTVLNPVECLKRVSFRESLPSIVQYMKDCHSRCGASET